jgi:hypothetical protein
MTTGRTGTAAGVASAAQAVSKGAAAREAGRERRKVLLEDNARFFRRYVLLTRPLQTTLRFTVKKWFKMLGT